MRKYDTVLFDLDGTLLNTLDDLADSVNHILTANGCPLRSREEVRSFLGTGSRRLMAQALPQGENTPDFEQLLEEYKEWYNTHCMVRTDFYPGVAQVLERLKQEGCAVAVVSNKHAAAASRLKEKFFPDLLAMGQKEGIRRKPAPDMVEAALQKLGRTKEGAVYVGDSEVDLETARNAGLPCILVSWGFRSRKALEPLGAEHLVDTAEELLTCLVG